MQKVQIIIIKSTYCLIYVSVCAQCKAGNGQQMEAMLDALGGVCRASLSAQNGASYMSFGHGISDFSAP